jgi:hypothetical protein
MPGPPAEDTRTSGQDIRDVETAGYTGNGDPRAKGQPKGKGSEAGQRLRILEMLFGNLDSQAKGWLSAEDVHRFAFLMGYQKTASEWQEDWEEVCAQTDLDKEGLTWDAFCWLVTDEGAGFHLSARNASEVLGDAEDPRAWVAFEKHMRGEPASESSEAAISEAAISETPNTDDDPWDEVVGADPLRADQIPVPSQSSGMDNGLPSPAVTALGLDPGTPQDAMGPSSSAAQQSSPCPGAATGTGGGTANNSAPSPSTDLLGLGSPPPDPTVKAGCCNGRHGRGVGPK